MVSQKGTYQSQKDEAILIQRMKRNPLKKIQTNAHVNNAHNATEFFYDMFEDVDDTVAEGADKAESRTKRRQLESPQDK